MQTYAQKAKKAQKQSLNQTPVIARSEATQQSTLPSPDITDSIDLGSSGRSLQLPEVLRERVQSQFGFSPESIRMKESSQVADFGAKAMAQGNIISFAPGKFDPYTESGQSLIGHELSHIVQQAKGLGSNIESSNIHYDPSSESASDTAGHLFATGSAGTMSSASPITPIAASAAPVQGKGVSGGKKKKPVARGKVPVKQPVKEKPPEPPPIPLLPMKPYLYGDESIQKAEDFMDKQTKSAGDMKDEFIKVNSNLPGIDTGGGHVGPLNQTKVDGRQIYKLVRGMNEEERKNFMLDMGSGEISRKQKHIDKFMNDASNRMMDFDESMLDEEYIINNLDKVMAIVDDSGAYDNLSQQKDYNLNEKSKDLLISNISGDYGSYVAEVLKLYGITKFAGKKVDPNNETEMFGHRFLAQDMKDKVLEKLPAYKKQQEKWKAKENPNWKMHDEYKKYFRRNEEYQKVFKRTVGKGGIKGFDSRMVQNYSRGLTEEQQEQMWKDMMSGGAGKKKHDMRVWKQMLDSNAAMTDKKYTDENYFKDNMIDSLDRTYDVNMTDNFLNTGFRPKGHERRLLNKTKDLGNMTNLWQLSALGSHGIDQYGDLEGRLMKPSPNKSLEDIQQSQASNIQMMKMYRGQMEHKTGNKMDMFGQGSAGVESYKKADKNTIGGFFRRLFGGIFG